MGFSFGKQASSQPGAEGRADSSSAGSLNITPEAGLKKFKKLHKWDPFMEVEQLDAADE